MFFFPQSNNLFFLLKLVFKQILTLKGKNIVVCEIHSFSFFFLFFLLLEWCIFHTLMNLIFYIRISLSHIFVCERINEGIRQAEIYLR